MRPGEAVNLTWGDIDWDRNTFTVTGGKRGTKNLDVRVVPLFPVMRDLLECLGGDAAPGPAERTSQLIVPSAPSSVRAEMQNCAPFSTPESKTEKS